MGSEESIRHSHFDSTSLETRLKKFQLILARNGKEKKLSRLVGRSAGRPAGSGQSENLRIRLTQTLSRALVRLGLSLAIKSHFARGQLRR